MAAKLSELSPKTLPQFVEHIEQLQNSAGHQLWYRGAGLTTHKLIPTLYRHPQAGPSFDFQELERKIMGRFKQRGLPYHERDLSDDWEALFFMQHYGVPTRLLDWTENPFTALYFALMGSPWTEGAGAKRVHTKPAVVWVLDPEAWNQRALEHISFRGGAMSMGEDPLNGFAPSNSAPISNAYPVAMYGSHNSVRIVAQQGVFTIFGTNRTPMETLVRDGTFPPNALSRLTISPGHIETMRKSLLAKGITETVIFPDLEGLAKETKRFFGYEQ